MTRSLDTLIHLIIHFLPFLMLVQKPHMMNMSRSIRPNALLYEILFLEGLILLPSEQLWS